MIGEGAPTQLDCILHEVRLTSFFFFFFKTELSPSHMDSEDQKTTKNLFEVRWNYSLDW